MAKVARIKLVADIEVPEEFEMGEDFLDALADAISTGDMDLNGVELVYDFEDGHTTPVNVSFIGFNADVEFRED